MLTSPPPVDRAPPGVSEAVWRRFCRPDAVTREVSAHSYSLPDCIIHFDSDEHSYFAWAEFKQGRGSREVCRGSLDRVMDTIADWRRNGLPLGPHHVAERAHKWTYHENDRSHRATTPLGDAWIRPFIGDLYQLVLVPDHALCVLFESRDIEELKRLAYELPATPHLAIRVSGIRYAFKVSSRPGVIAQVQVHGVTYVLVPHVDERGIACVAVEAELPRFGFAVNRALVHRLAVHPTADLEHLDMLWSGGDEELRVWSRPRPISTKHTDAPRTGPNASDRKPETRGAAPRTDQASDPPEGVDPLAWDGFVRQAAHTATLAFDKRLGRPLYVASMRAQCAEALIAAARKGKSIRGSGTVLRRQLETGAGTRLEGSQSAFKEWMRVLMNHTRLARQTGRYARELPLAELFVSDSEFSKEMMAHALAVRGGVHSAPDPSAQATSRGEPTAGTLDIDDSAPPPSPDPARDRPPSGPEQVSVHAVLVMNGDRIVASRFGVPSDDAEAVVRELKATAGPHTHVLLDGTNVWLDDPPDAAITPEGRGQEGDVAATRAESVEEPNLTPTAGPRAGAPGSGSSGTGTDPAARAATSAPARAPQSPSHTGPPHGSSPAHRQHPPPDVTRNPGDREHLPGSRSRDGPPGRRSQFREADLNEDLSKWMDE